MALWDLKGKALGQPVWRLLGGARARVPVYATFGFAFFDRDELAAAAKIWVDARLPAPEDDRRHQALPRRDEPRPLDEVIGEDVARVRAVREAVGPESRSTSTPTAASTSSTRLRWPRDRALRHPFFEEPVTQNDMLADGASCAPTAIPLAGGQNEGLASASATCWCNQAVDVVQPNA